MTTGKLLKSLLDIAGLSQKSFAGSISISSSKLSKLINSNIFLSRKEASDFFERASRILANEIFEPDCWFKLQSLFPFVVKFRSRHELYQFLLTAFSYSNVLDREAADKSVPDRSRKDLHYFGTQECKYIFCIITSDYLTRDIQQKHEFFSSLPRYSDKYIECFEDIIPLIPPKKFKMNMQQFFQLQGKFSGPVRSGKGMVERIFKEEEYSDLYLWELEFESDNHFFMLKNHFVLLFNEYVDGTPQITLIRNQNQLDHYSDFVDAAMKKAGLRSFRQDNVKDFLEQKADKYEEVRSKMRVLSDLAGIIDSTDFLDPLLFFDSLLKNEAALYITSDALIDFLFSRSISDQLLKIENIPLPDRIKYVREFYKYLDEHKNSRINIIESDIYGIVVICQGKSSLICLVNVSGKILKYHIVQTEAVAEEMTSWASRSAIDSTLFIKTLMRQVRDQ